MSENHSGAESGASNKPGPGIPLSRRDFIGGALAGATGMGLHEAAGAELKPLNRVNDPAKVVDPHTRIPTTAVPNGLNLIVIVADTFRADHLGCYGSTRVKTPNLDRLAAQSVMFMNANAEGLPTIPCRRVYHTGRSVLPEARWQPLHEHDVTLAEVLRKHGFTSGFIVDTFHHFKPSYNFHRGFDSWEWIRGQETDAYSSGPKDSVDPKRHIPPHLWNEKYDANMRQYLLNTQHRQGEEDYFCAQSCRAAAKWLEQNAGNKPFMLWLDMFDPHEPWDAPPRFQKMYRDEYPCERYLFGYGVRVKDIRPDDLPVIRDLYAADVTHTDHCIGQLLTCVERLGLMRNTVIVFTTDHGTHLGEEGCVHKTPGLLNRCVTHIPLIIRHPDQRYAGQRIEGLVSAVDFMPSMLGLLGVDDYQEMDGRNIWKLVEGQAASIHDYVYTVFGDFGAVRSKDWHYFQNIAGTAPGKGPCLYNLKDDPQQTRNVLREFPQAAKAMREQLQQHLGVAIPTLES